MKSLPDIGAHVSAAGGPHKVFENAALIGAQALQFFGASPQQWAAKLPGDKDVEAFQAAWKQSEVTQVYLHAAYLVNLASINEMLRARSILNLTQHLKIAQLFGAQGLVFHIGSGREQTREDAITKTIDAMKTVLANAPGETLLIMENAAGGGEKIGVQPQEFGVIMRELADARVRVCIDTAHAFEAGIIEEYSPEGIRAMLEAWDKEVGLGNVAVLHVNDSKTPSGSRHDRHENLGEGHIGLEGFVNLARETVLYDKAWILEVPGFEGFGPDKRNVDILKSCFENT